ncbi:MAG: hypothetical protein Kow0073_17070 [Immundisolibacter sp.]
MTGIVFVVGASRSGSTLLERLLNELPGVLSVGELMRVWQRGVVENQLCSCGQAFHDCPFWSAVLQRLDCGGDAAGANAADVLSRRVYKAGLGVPPPAQRRAFLDLWGALFRAIAEVGDARWLIDSSKDPAYAAQLAGLPGFDTRYLHLVRDARAVAHSKGRRRRRPEIHWRPAYMARRSAWGSAGSWNASQRLAERARVRSDRPWRLLRYEDLAADPRAALQGLLQWLQLPVAGDTALDFLQEGVARVRPGHSVSGNPMRFNHGELVVRPDCEWRAAMPVLSRLAVTLRSYRGLHRYGYL